MSFRNLLKIFNITVVIVLSILHSFDLFYFDTSKFVTSVAVISMALNEVIDKLKYNQIGGKDVEEERHKNHSGSTKP